MNDFDPCLLHIPFKENPSPDQMLQNYLEMERWAVRLRGCGGGTCSCGDTLEVEQDTQSSSSASFYVTSTGTVDPNNYNYDGGTAITWDSINKRVQINEDGIYAVRTSVFVTTFDDSTITPGGSIVGVISRWDIADLTGEKLGKDGEQNEANDSQSSSPVINLHPTLPGYPMPAGSTWAMLIENNTAGLVQLIVRWLVTKVNCGTIPVRP